MGVYVQIVPGDEWVKVTDALRRLDATLPAKLRRRLREEVRDVVADVKDHARRLPSRKLSRKATALRRTVARGVGVQVATGGRSGVFRMRIITRVPRQDMAIIPRGMDFVPGRRIGWRHPIFGNREKWVHQKTPQGGWFREEISDHREQIAERLADVLQEAKDILQRAGNGGTIQLPDNWH